MAVNWDNDNQILEEPLQLPDQQPVDLTRFEYRQRADCGGRVIPPVYETLTSHRDWNLLTYAPPEDTTEPEMAGSSVAEPLAEMDQHLFFSIIDAIWVDQTISTDTSLFRDGFESGEGQ